MSIIASVPAPAGSRLIDADTATLTAIAQGDRARQAWDAIQTNSNATVAQVAARLDITPAEMYHLALDYIAAQTGWTAGQKRQAVEEIPGDPALCPAWCTVDHTEDGAERMHHSDVGEVIALAGDDMHQQKFVGVEVETYESPALPGGIDPGTIYLTMGDQADNQTESSAYLTPELAEQLAAALFQAARLARQARR